MGGDAVASSKSNLDLGRKKPRRTEAEIKRDCEKRLEADETGKQKLTKQQRHKVKKALEKIKARVAAKRHVAAAAVAAKVKKKLKKNKARVAAKRYVAAAAVATRTTTKETTTTTKTTTTRPTTKTKQTTTKTKQTTTKTTTTWPTTTTKETTTTTTTKETTTKETTTLTAEASIENARKRKRGYRMNYGPECYNKCESLILLKVSKSEGWAQPTIPKEEVEPMCDLAKHISAALTTRFTQVMDIYVLRGCQLGHELAPWLNGFFYELQISFNGRPAFQKVFTDYCARRVNGM